MQHKLQLIALLSAIITSSFVLCQREARRQASTTDFYKDFKSPCGSADQISARLGECMSHIFDLILGKVPAAKTDADFLAYCDRFVNAEKCARTVSKDCLSGLHKTSVGAVATAIKRWRSVACKTPESRARYGDPVKCAIKKGPEISVVYQNHTGIVQGIRDLNIPPEEKIIKMCCVLNSLDREMETRYNRECPQQTQLILSIVHAITDDARTTLCANPKCGGAFDKVINNKYKPPQTFIEPPLQILFQLSVN